ncbi:uracil-DNA glycosylase [Stutzerimonas urumqiensis]|uniref:uracil-DNA glycosylase family protein n=1 Tax=Stutzerimonas urumqiensis TaxID=638269 RepID=UPI003BAA1270
MSADPLDETQRAAFRDLAAATDGIDRAAYAAADRDPLEPLIGEGNPRSPLCFLGRDPGREEVKWGEPFVGAGGRLLRGVLFRHLHGHDAADQAALRGLTPHYFWLNTVPYKPIGNKAWSMSVKARFQPLIRGLMLERWQGRDVITLGREAFLWFGIDQPRPEREALEAFWRRDDRFEASLDVSLRSPTRARTLRLHPLPHPSPLNQRWFRQFATLLEARLSTLAIEPAR